MSGSVTTAEKTQVNRVQIPRNLPKVLRILGIIIIIAGLQSYAFYNNFIPKINLANIGLDHLMDEVVTNKFVNEVLNNLGDLRRLSEDDVYRKEIVQIYERFIEDFLEDPREAISELSRIVATLSPPLGALGEESMTTVMVGVEQLEGLYSDRYQTLQEDLETPPFYLQPTASIIKQSSVLGQNIRFNHGVYLALVGDRGEANTIFNDLKREEVTSEFLSVINYAQARLLFDAFEKEGQFDYYTQAIETLKESLRNNSDYGQPKLFLEYLLSLDRGSREVNAPVTGDGSGEAEGERGVISSAPPNF